MTPPSPLSPPSTLSPAHPPSASSSHASASTTSLSAITEAKPWSEPNGEIEAVTEPDPAATAVATPPADASPSAAFLQLIPHEFARRHLILSTGTHSPIDGSDGAVEHLLVAPSTSPAAVINTGVRLSRPVCTTLGSADQIAQAIDKAYSGAPDHSNSPQRSEDPAIVVEGSSAVEEDLGVAVREAERDLLSTHGKSPVVRLVDLVLFEALMRGASDVHIQPLRDRTLVRYRLDGALHTARELPASLAGSVVTRIKVLARLDVAERRAPQDGRASVTIGGRGGREGRDDRAHSTSKGVDLRISTLPSTFGERIVIRLLDQSRSPHTLSFAALGMPNEIRTRFLAQVSRTSGIVLSTGPTGSGKTTTLYTTLSWINSTNAGGIARGCELNIMTVEDPVEYDLSCGGMSVSQTQVDPKKNVTFAAGLRHILRQDPDVIMVGEIRDEETARIAVQSSLTGHLVLSTLHTNDAASAVARLLDLGVEPFLVSSSLTAVLAQRLVRRVHAACNSKGCDACMGTGFKGRQGVFELLVVDPNIRELIVRQAPANLIKEASRRSGMTTLREAGERLVAQGLTTREEVARVVDLHEEDLL